ncbi:hypothetical protein KA005_04705, partial [bacterium]|nr:hypothetical protein [bacterium]
RWPGGWNNWYNFHSDNRKKIRFSFGGNNFWGDNRASRDNSFWFSGTYHPSNALTISLSPSFSIKEQNLQYVSTEEFDTEKRYIFAKIDQKTLGITLRLNLSITPDLSIQFYGQPFASAGKYSRFKHITEPRANEFESRYHAFTGDEISYDSDEDQFQIDENLDGTIEYNISNPNFNFLQFRSNLLLRWEYTPGSVLYLVWAQGRTGNLSNGDFSFNNDMQHLFDVHPHNVFLIKFSYCFKL